MPTPIMRTRTNSRVSVCQFRSLASSRYLNCGCGCEDCKCYVCHSEKTADGTECVTDGTAKVLPFIESGEVLNCATCPFYEASVDRHKWPFTSEDAIREIRGPIVHRDKSWAECPTIQWGHRDLLDEVVAKEYPVPELKGRGIIIAASGQVYYDCAYVSAYMLRALGCKLPIQFWYTGSKNMTDEKREAVAKLGVECVDSESFPKPRLMGGWELKPFSILNSEFEEVIFMDADNLPVVDPTYLFDDPRYQEAGSVFWPDLASNQVAISPEAWAVANVEPTTIRIESGFMLIDKRKCWKALNVTQHMNEHSDFWYQVQYGDQNTFLLSWLKTGTKFLMAPQSEWVGSCFHECDLDGNHLSNHCCQGKKEIVAGNPVPGVINSQLARAGAFHRMHAFSKGGK